MQGYSSPAKHRSSHYDEEHYRAVFREAPYYSTGRDWCDYAPAYHYGHTAREEHPNERFEEIETQLARDWLRRKAESRLLWTEARGAVHDAWCRHDEAEPGAVHHGH